MEEGMEDYFDEAMENEEDAMEEDEERGHFLRRTFQPYGIAGLRTYGAGLQTYDAGLHRGLSYGLNRGLSYGLNYRPAVYGHNLGWRSSVYGATHGVRPAVYGAAFRPVVYGATYGAAFRPAVYCAGYGIRRPFAYGTGLTHRPALWGAFGHRTAAY